MQEQHDVRVEQDIQEPIAAGWCLDFDLPKFAFELTKDRTTIGSRPDNDLAVPIKGVSRKHAQILKLSGRHILEDLVSHGFQINRLFAGGGGAKSRLWMEIHADILGRPIVLPRESEACALGSAMVAAVHCCHFANLGEAAEKMVQIASVIEPRQRMTQIYESLFAKYLATYPALKQLMHEMADSPRGES